MPGRAGGNAGCLGRTSWVLLKFPAGRPNLEAAALAARE
jgi:hypothetical protein